MANTLTVTSVVDHTSDAGFRTWGAEFHASLVSIGLTLTSDTGQINWTTVTRSAASNTTAGYEIWRFNDSLQSTTPIFLKIEFGTGATANQPLIWITIGNGSNGSGTLTGLTSARIATSNAGSTSYGVTVTSTVTTYTSRFVYNPTLGFFGFAWKIGAALTDACSAAAFVFRSNDTTGAATSTSVSLLAGKSDTGTTTMYNGLLQTLNYTTGLLYPSAGAFAQMGWYSTHPFALTATLVGSTVDIDPVFYLSPSINVAVGLGRALKSEVAMGTAVSATLVGSTAHTYVQIGCPHYSTQTVTLAGSYVGADAYNQGLSGATLGLMMLWE